MTPFFLAIQILAAVEPVPPLTGPVVDLAEMIDGPHRAQLEQLARAEKESNGVQLQILTVPSIGDEPIEHFSVRIAEALKIASKGNDNGILIVVAKAERRFRLQALGGLDLTDLQAKRILDDTLTPAFASGDYGAGLYSAAVAALRAVPGQQAPQPDVAGGGDPVSPCEVWMSLDSKISVLTEADSKEASKVDALMREGKIEAGDRWSNAMKASSDDHNALEQVEAALRNCDYLAKRQRGICENQVVTSRPPDCASLSAIQRHDHVPCTPRLPGGAQRAPPPMDETAVSACLSSRMEQLAKDNAGRAQPFTDWIAQTIGARAAAALRAKQIAAARADPAMVLHANSAYLCALLAHKAEKAAEIKKEKTYAARYGQVIDMEGIHDDQERIKADDEEIEKVKADLSRAKPLPCKDASVAAGAACIRAYLDAHGANVQTDVTCDDAVILFE